MISRYVKAGFPILGIRSWEPAVLGQEIVQDVQALQKEMGGVPFTIWNWECINGLQCLSDRSQKPSDKCQDPSELLNFIPRSDDGSIFIIHNFGRFLKSLEIIQQLINIVPFFKNKLRMIIFVAPSIELPTELERVVTILDHDLPKREKLEEILSKYINEYKDDFKIPVNDELAAKAVDAGLGQTAFEFENGVSLCITERKTIDPATIWEMKSQIVKKNGNLELGDFSEKLSDLKGLENLKDFGLSVMGNPHARGMLLLGVPGTGKSHFAKGLGNALRLPTLCLDFGRLFGSLVGQSEERARNAIRVIEAMAPCIPFIDEIEKGLSGVQSSGQTDSGVSARVLGTFLTWMSDHTCQTPIIATCNNIDRLPTEFLRAERWDAIFFLDLPTEEEGIAILKHHMGKYEITENPENIFEEFKLKNWTGAELKSLCRLAYIMKGDLHKAKQYVVPIYQSREEEINRLRRYAGDVAVRASLVDDTKNPDDANVQSFSGTRKLKVGKKNTSGGTGAAEATNK